MVITTQMRHCIILVSLALIINCIFLGFTMHNKEYCAGTLHPHGEIGLSIYKHNSFLINPDRLAHVAQIQKESSTLVNYSQLDHAAYGEPSAYRTIYDTIGFGILLGCLWKITHSLSYIDIQIFHVIIFSLLLILIYMSALLLFGNQLCAFWCGLAHLAFLPLVFQNVQAHRDIWAYYGVVIFLFSLLAFFCDRLGIVSLCSLLSLFALIQFIRPLIFFTPLAVLGLISLYAFFEKKIRFKIFTFALIWCITNLLFFWLPFCAYNSMAYQRALLMPSGLGLLEGLGEYDNPWGYKLNDEWFTSFMKENYGLEAGTVECDDKAREIFKMRLKENPLLFIKAVITRLGSLLLPNLPWSFYPEEWYAHAHSLKDKIRRAFSSPFIALDFITRLLYIRLFLLFAYAGLILMLRRRKILEALIIGGIVASCLSIVPSHIEYRYIVPFYSAFCFCAGYAFYSIIKVLEDRLSKKKDVYATHPLAHA